MVNSGSFDADGQPVKIQCSQMDSGAVSRSSPCPGTCQDAASVRPTQNGVADKTHPEKVTSLHCRVPLDKIRDILHTINAVMSSTELRSAEVSSSDSSSDSSSSEMSDEISAEKSSAEKSYEISVEKVEASLKDETPKSDPSKPLSSKRLLCLFCERTFLTQSLKQKHVDRCHSLGQVRRSSSRTPSHNQAASACCFCSKLNNTERTLTQLLEHLIKEHSNRYYACLPCQERFTTNQHLVDHNQVIHGIEPTARVPTPPPAIPEPPTISETPPPVPLVSNTLEDFEDTIKANVITAQPPEDVAIKPKPRKVKKVTLKTIKNGVKGSMRTTRSSVKETVQKKKKPKPEPPKDPEKKDSSSSVFSLVNAYIYTHEKISNHSSDSIRDSNSVKFDAIFDRDFYNRTVYNIRDNLMHFLDGKLNRNVESETRISQFEQNHDEKKLNKGDNFGSDISVNAVTPVATLLASSQYGEDFDSQIEYGAKASQKKTKTVSPMKYKYCNKKPSAFNKNLEHSDLTALDMWTQLIVKKRQQRPHENTNNAQRQVEDLNRILDKRGPFEDLQLEARNQNKSAKRDIQFILDDLLQDVFDVSESKPVPVTKVSENMNPEIPNYLGLVETEVPADVTSCNKVELSGEWARPRLYICATCGFKLPNMKALDDHKNMFHPHIWAAHYELVGSQSSIYRHLSIPGLGKVGYVETLPLNRIWQRSDARNCTKCSKHCHNLGELHRHILECGGDWTWMLARKKCKYRPYGARTRRRRQRGYKRNLDVPRTPREPKIKPIQNGPRPKPSDADTIERMLANLPAKRHRKVISMRDGIQRPRKPYNYKNSKPSTSQDNAKKHNRVMYKNNVNLANQNMKNALKRKFEARTLRKRNESEEQEEERIPKGISKKKLTRVLGSKLFDNNTNIMSRRRLVQAITQNNFVRRTRLRARNAEKDKPESDKEEEVQVDKKDSKSKKSKGDDESTLKSTKKRLIAAFTKKSKKIKNTSDDKPQNISEDSSSNDSKSLRVTRNSLLKANDDPVLSVVIEKLDKKPKSDKANTFSKVLRKKVNKFVENMKNKSEEPKPKDKSIALKLMRSLSLRHSKRQKGELKKTPEVRSDDLETMPTLEKFAPLPDGGRDTNSEIIPTLSPVYVAGPAKKSSQTESAVAAEVEPSTETVPAEEVGATPSITIPASSNPEITISEAPIPPDKSLEVGHLGYDSTAIWQTLQNLEKISKTMKQMPESLLRPEFHQIYPFQKAISEDFRQNLLIKSLLEQSFPKKPVTVPDEIVALRQRLPENVVLKPLLPQRWGIPFPPQEEPQHNDVTLKAILKPQMDKPETYRLTDEVSISVHNKGVWDSQMDAAAKSRTSGVEAHLSVNHSKPTPNELLMIARTPKPIIEPSITLELTKRAPKPDVELPKVVNNIEKTIGAVIAADTSKISTSDTVASSKSNSNPLNKFKSKIKRSGKGLNDCIAMLKCKLEQKIQNTTENPLVDKSNLFILNSVEVNRSNPPSEAEKPVESTKSADSIVIPVPEVQTDTSPVEPLPVEDLQRNEQLNFVINEAMKNSLLQCVKNKCEELKNVSVKAPKERKIGSVRKRQRRTKTSPPKSPVKVVETTSDDDVPLKHFVSRNKLKIKIPKSKKKRRIKRKISFAPLILNKEDFVPEFNVEQGLARLDNSMNEKLETIRVEKAAEINSDIREVSGVEVADLQVDKMVDGQEESVEMADIRDRTGNKMADVQEGSVNKMTDINDRLETKMADIHDRVRNKMADIHDRLGNKMADIQVGSVNKLVDIQDRLGNKMADIHDRLEDKMADIRDRAGNKMADIHDRAGNQMVDNHVRVENKTADIHDRAGNKMADIPDRAGNKMADIPDRAGNKMADVQFGTVNKLGDIHDRLENKMADIHHRLGNQMADIHNMAGNKMADIHDRLGNQMVDIHDKVGNKMVSNHDTVEDKMADIHDRLGNKMADIHDRLRNQMVDNHDRVENKMADIHDMAGNKMVDNHDRVENKMADIHDRTRNKMVDNHDRVENKMADIHDRTGNKMVDNHDRIANKMVDNHDQIENKMVDIPYLIDKKMLDIHDRIENKMVDIPYRIDKKMVDIHDRIENKMVDIPYRIETKTVDIHDRIENKMVDIPYRIDKKMLDIPDRIENKMVDISDRIEKKMVDIHDRIENKMVDIPDRIDKKMLDIPDRIDNKMVDIQDGSINNLADTQGSSDVVTTTTENEVPIDLDISVESTTVQNQVVQVDVHVESAHLQEDQHDVEATNLEEQSLDSIPLPLHFPEMEDVPNDVYLIDKTLNDSNLNATPQRQNVAVCDEQSSDDADKENATKSSKHKKRKRSSKKNQIKQICKIKIKKVVPISSGGGENVPTLVVENVEEALSESDKLVATKSDSEDELPLAFFVKKSKGDVKDVDNLTSDSLPDLHNIDSELNIISVTSSVEHTLEELTNLSIDKIDEMTQQSEVMNADDSSKICETEACNLVEDETQTISDFITTPDLADKSLILKIKKNFKLKRGKKNRKRVLVKATVKSKKEPEQVEVLCDICNKTFRRTENLVKHKRTLTHIAKLSELEAKESMARQNSEDKENYVEQTDEKDLSVDDTSGSVPMNESPVESAIVSSIESSQETPDFVQPQVVSPVDVFPNVEISLAPSDIAVQVDEVTVDYNSSVPARLNTPDIHPDDSDDVLIIEDRFVAPEIADKCTDIQIIDDDTVDFRIGVPKPTEQVQVIDDDSDYDKNIQTKSLAFTQFRDRRITETSSNSDNNHSEKLPVDNYCGSVTMIEDISVDQTEFSSIASEKNDFANTLDDISSGIENAVDSPKSVNGEVRNLKLVDIINNVLDKPVEAAKSDGEYFPGNMISQNSSSDNFSEPRRYKSLGERKSFDSDSFILPQKCLDDMLSNESYTPKSVNDGMLTKQLTLLENIIEETKTNLNYIEDSISLSSNQFEESSEPVEKEYTHDPVTGNRIQFSHSTDILSDYIKPAYEKPNHYDDISQPTFDEDKTYKDTTRKILNRDEELFLECCSLLKSGSEISNKKPLQPIPLEYENNQNWLEKKQSEISDRYIPKDGYGWLAQAPRTDTPNSEFNNEWLDSNSAVSSEWLRQKPSPDRPVETKTINDKANNNSRIKYSDIQFEDISLDSTATNNTLIVENAKTNQDIPIDFHDVDFSKKELAKKDKSDVPVEKPELDLAVEVRNGADEDKDDSGEKNDVQEPPQVDPDLKKKVVTAFGGLMARALNSRLQAVVRRSNKIREKRALTSIQPSITDFAVPIKKNKPSSLDSDSNDVPKKLITKGAMKIFEGLKVSIPVHDLNLKEVLSCTLKKKLEGPLADKDSSFVKTGNKLGLRETKKKIKCDNKNDKKDIYDFDESQDDSMKTSSLPVFRKFRDADKGDGSDDLKSVESDSETDRYYDSMSFEENSVSSLSLPNSKSRRVQKSSLKKDNQKKCMIMGRIFKNASKPKLEDKIPEIRDFSFEENSKMVETYLESCSSMDNVESNIGYESLPLVSDVTVNNANKMSKKEMDMLFDKLLEGEKAKSESVEAKDTDGNVSERTDKSKRSDKSKIKCPKSKKRQRHNSEESTSSEEFRLPGRTTKPKKAHRVPRKHKKDAGINLEQEFKECIGVAGRKSQRKCTSGKQNVLAEFWSSDESSFEDLLKVLEDGAPPAQEDSLEDTDKPPELPKPNPDIYNFESDDSEPKNENKPRTKKEKRPKSRAKKNKIEEDHNFETQRICRKSDTRTKSTEHIEDKSDDEPATFRRLSEVSAESLATTRRKRNAGNQLYYWSSSSDDETLDMIEVKPLREDIDDDRPMQHGWIVGDSPKKLVTMLAQAKGKKVDCESVKEQHRKNRGSL